MNAMQSAINTDSDASRTRWRDGQPVILTASITNGIKTLVLSVLSLSLAFGWVRWENEQIAAVLSVIAASFVLLSAVLAAYTHEKVTPVDANGVPRAAVGNAVEGDEGA